MRFNVNNLSIGPVSKAKYLRVVFAKNARFDRYIDHIIAKTNTSMAPARDIFKNNQPFYSKINL